MIRPRVPRALVGLAFLLATVPAHAREGSGVNLRFSVPVPSLGGRTRDIRVHLPAGYSDDPDSLVHRYPVVVLLHGFPGGSGDWIARGHAGEVADTLALAGRIPRVILVCPDGNHGFFGRSLWANFADGSFALEDDLVRDLPDWIDRTFRTRPGPRERAVIGLSDGGTAAVNLVLRHPDRYGAAAACSADYRIGEGFGIPTITGDGEAGAAYRAHLSPLDYLTREALPEPLPRLAIDCGTDDESLAQNREFHELLEHLHVPHAYAEAPGSHAWEYWRSRLPIALEHVTAGFDPAGARGGGPPGS